MYVSFVEGTDTYDMRVPRDPEEFRRQRIEKVSAWIGVLEEAARELELELLSRRSETASEAGVDPDPRLRPCEHRTEWQRGLLCLACDNTGLRPATQKERVEDMAFDPYLLNPPRERYGVTRDQSDSARRARNLEQLNAAIETLERNARIREGVEVHEGELAAVRASERLWRSLGRDGQKVAEALESMHYRYPGIYQLALDRDPTALALVARLVPGRIHAPAGEQAATIPVPTTGAATAR